MNIPFDLREAGIWHEVGHIHHEHPIKMKYQDQTKLREARIKAIKSGGIVSEEKEADQFAIAHIGKDALSDFLRYVLSTRPTGDKSSLNDLGRRELENRISIINGQM